MGALLDYDQKQLVRAAILALPQYSQDCFCVKNALAMTKWGANTLFDNEVLEILGLSEMCDSVSY